VQIYPGVDHEGTVTPLSLLYRDRIPLLRDASAFARRATAAVPRATASR
jgi:hypothetical protein